MKSNLKRRAHSDSICDTKMSRYTKLWRESTSIIPLVRKKNMRNVQCAFNYDLLVQKRSKKTKFMPNAIVFPGGEFEAKDSSLEWIDYLKSFNIPDEKINIYNSKQGWDTPIFNDDNSDLNRHISLRISAIRETFEELGVLICKQNGKDANAKPWATSMADFNVKMWQDKVHNNPQEFINLCQDLKCYPDIWSLYYWSNWLTPVGLHPKRFDAAFFLVFFESLPSIERESTEVTKVLISTPNELLTKFYDGEILLPPTQFYELLRLKSKEKIEDIIKFVEEGNPKAPEVIFPLVLRVKDGRAFILPKDDMYTENVQFNEESLPVEIAIKYKDKTLEEMRDELKVVHRLEFSDKLQIALRNYVPEGNHIIPSKA